VPDLPLWLDVQGGISSCQDLLLRWILLSVHV
jgi:hypothetical protein